MSWPSYPERDYAKRKRFGLYFDVREEAKSWGLRVHGVGSFESRREDISRNGRVLNQYALIMVRKGIGYFHEDQTKVRKLCAGDIVVVTPGDWHLYNPDQEEGWETSWIIFDGPVAESLHDAGEIGFGLLVSGVGESGLKALGAIFDGIIKMSASRQDTLELQARLAAELLGLLARISDWKNQQHRAVSREGVADAVRFVEEHYAGEIDFEKLRMQAGVSQTHFRRQFKSVAGDGPQTYQQRLRIRLARELIRNSKYSVAEVGRRVGYEKPAYFSRVFRARVGMSPLEWRKSGLGSVD